jgi:hypothetical protein
MKTTLLCFGFALFLSSHEAYASEDKFQINDVSYLFDLPLSHESIDYLLSTESKGTKGELLSFDKYEAFRPLMTTMEQAGSSYTEFESLRVIGMRIDPCFQFDLPLRTEDVNCSHQMRLIWQPVVKDENYTFTTLDASVHSFYKLSPEEFSELKSDLMNLKKKLKITTSGLPLGVHPALKMANTRDMFSKGIKTIMLNYAGDSNLIRYTFMKLLSEKIWWEFGGVDIKNGVPTKISIPRYDASVVEQHFFQNDFFDPLKMRASITPEIESKVVKEDNFYEVVKGYSYYFNPSYRKKLVQAIQTINRVENPAIHSPESIDCVHCHISTQTKYWLHKKDSSLFSEKGSGKDNFSLSVKPVDHLALKNTSPQKENIKSLRMFGYFGKELAISQRTINESFNTMIILNN